MDKESGTTETLGLRERKKLETRRAIRRAALDYALEHGIENLTVEIIAEEVGISSRTFFNYFSSKEEALITDTSKITERLRPLIDQRPLDEAPFRTLRIVFTENDPLALTGADRPRAMARMQLIHQDIGLMRHQMTQQITFEKSLAEILAERLRVDIDSDPRPELLAGVTGSIFSIAIRRWAKGSPGTLLEILREAFNQVENGGLNEPPSTNA